MEVVKQEPGIELLRRQVTEAGVVALLDQRGNRAGYGVPGKWYVDFCCPGLVRSWPKPRKIYPLVEIDRYGEFGCTKCCYFTKVAPLGRKEIPETVQSCANCGKEHKVFRPNLFLRDQW